MISYQTKYLITFFLQMPPNIKNTTAAVHVHRVYERPAAQQSTRFKSDPVSFAPHKARERVPTP